MSYEESFPTIVTQIEAIAEIKKHHVCPSEFFEDYGLKDEYKASDLLAWLGY